MEPKVDWTSIPDELLALVLDKLPLLPDYLHFSAICKSWNNVARSEFDRRKVINISHPQLPMLLVPLKDGSEKKFGLYHIIKNKNLEYKVSVPYDWRCCGSSHGWLFFASKTHLFMSNPFTRDPPHRLPPMKLELHENDDEFAYIHNVYKTILSCDPSLYPDDYEVVVIYGELLNLAIFKAGDKDWTTIEGNPLPLFFDVIYHKGYFYVLNQFMGLGRINVTCNKLIRSYKIDMIVPNGPQYEAQLGFGTNRLPHLVESSKGHLICALRIVVDNEDGKPGQVTSSFKLFKLEKVLECDPCMRWVDTNALGGDTIFVGENHSLAINNNTVGCPSNCIYFTDIIGSWLGFYKLPSYRDIGVFNIETQTLGYHFSIDYLCIPPIWIVPSLN